MFLFKKIAGPFFFPLSLCLEVFIVGLILLWFTKKKRAGKIVVTAGVALIALLSYGPLPTWLLQPLEYKYPPLLKTDDLPRVKWIVVLGGGHTSDPQIPISSQISDASLFRLVEGIRLHKSFPGSKLILSGGVLYDPSSDAQSMSEVAEALGVDRQNVLLELRSKDTEDQARLIHQIVGNDPFVLVTSASHMPRSMALFHKQGMSPIPASTDYKVKEKQSKELVPGFFYPGLGELAKAEFAIYEYLGLAWLKLRGQI